MAEATAQLLDEVGDRHDATLPSARRGEGVQPPGQRVEPGVPVVDGALEVPEQLERDPANQARNRRQPPSTTSSGRSVSAKARSPATAAWNAEPGAGPVDPAGATPWAAASTSRVSSTRETRVAGPAVCRGAT